MPEQTHLSDVGTDYYLRCRDRHGDFDPSGATTKQLLFQWADGTVTTVTASVEIVPDSEGRTRWFFLYRAVSGFHTVEGLFKIQARIIYPDGSTWSSDIQTTDEDGMPYEVVRNVDTP
jgi:hypothetical protein